MNILIGFLIAAAVGLTGIGGGSFTVPALVLLVGLPANACAAAESPEGPEPMMATLTCVSFGIGRPDGGGTARRRLSWADARSAPT